MIYGYARVSTDAQTLDEQIAALTAAGAQKVYSEKESGAKTNRSALARVLAAMDAGDVLLVTIGGSIGQKHPGPAEHAGNMRRSVEEYNVLIDGAVSALEVNTFEAREEMYDRARSSLQAEFDKLDPREFIEERFKLNFAILDREWSTAIKTSYANSA